jgi:hypothetical protein
VIFQPWIAHLFPGVTIAQLEAGYWSMSGIVEMADYAKGGPER